MNKGGDFLFKRDDEAAEALLSFAASAAPREPLEVPPLATLVAYLANALSPEEAHKVREAAVRYPDTGKQLAEVFAILEAIQEIPISDLAQETNEDGLRARVSVSWLALIRRSIEFSLEKRMADIKDLVASVIERKDADHWAALALLSPGAARRGGGLSPAWRSGEGEGLSLSGAIEDSGDLVIHVDVDPDRVADWESRQVEVLLNVRVPIKVGTGTVKNGRSEIRALNAKRLFDLLASPFDPTDLTVRETHEESIVWPAEGSTFASGECPRLTEPPTVEAGRLLLSIEIPPALRHGHPESTLAIDACFTPGSWQRIVSIPLKGAAPEVKSAVGWDGSEDRSGKIVLPLRFRLLN